MTEPQSTPESGTGAGTARPDVSRRTVLRATGGALAGAGLTSVSGTASAAGVPLAPLVRDGNRIVDPQGQPVTLRGVNVAEPSQQHRDWRGMGPVEVLDMATRHPEWDNTIVRVPIQPQFVATGEAAATGPDPSDLPHGDNWGPALPGTFDRDDLELYLEDVVDPLVERAAENGAYLQLVYRRDQPVFYHWEHEPYVENGQPVDDAAYDDLAEEWDCESDDAVDHTVLEEQDEDFETLPTEDRHPDVCGERGVLWHGEDQIDDVRQLALDQEYPEYVPGIESLDDVYTEPPAVCNALDAELTAFWEVAAEQYADDQHVLVDVYDQPSGPYAGGWGGPERVPGAIEPYPRDRPDYELWSEYARPFYELWVERSQPWLDVAENRLQGQVLSIGNPRWSQYVYWAPYDEYDNENVAYSAHAFTQPEIRPLQDTIGCASMQVPVIFANFGFQAHDLYVPTPWMDGDVAWAEGTYDPLHEGCDGDVDDCQVTQQKEGSLSFGEFVERFPVHPICSTFDHSWEPTFFDHGTPGVEGDGARGSDHWYDDGHLHEEATPGLFWKEFVDEKAETAADYAPNPGDEPYDGDAGPNVLDGDTDRGYAYPIGDEPAPGPCLDPYPREEGCGALYGDSALEVDGRTVCDLNGDGRYRDVTNDGTVGQDDVAAFFQVQHRDAWKREAFDFSGNGPVNQFDAVELFDYTLTN